MNRRRRGRYLKAPRRPPLPSSRRRAGKLELVARKTWLQSLGCVVAKKAVLNVDPIGGTKWRIKGRQQPPFPTPSSSPSFAGRRSSPSTART
ncbi:Os06g0573132 [Oryza sativa Japonica Group]|uniref:Os06g0573132 protein n=1 Tax=Oryza sativa subsp. japonica TaxID=39947 RepID=A0A0P0WYC1_ORYSJ|nr:Os06g0573132 [Oryza sativa Japonica Group]